MKAAIRPSAVSLFACSIGLPRFVITTNLIDIANAARFTEVDADGIKYHRRRLHHLSNAAAVFSNTSRMEVRSSPNP